MFIFPFSKSADHSKDLFDMPEKVIDENEDVPIVSRSIETKALDQALIISTRSKRPSKQPAHLKYYHCNNVCDVRYPISAYVNLTRLSIDHQAFICVVDKYFEPPRSYSQA